MEDNIKNIWSNTGVPPNGKCVGVFPSFARVFTYLDHVLQSCHAGKGSNYKMNLSKIRVLSYYLQKEVAALFTIFLKCVKCNKTDKHYAINVMKIDISFWRAYKDKAVS